MKTNANKIILEILWYKVKTRDFNWNLFLKRESVKTAPRAFTYSWIDIYDKQYSRDKKKNNVIKQHCEKYMILKPDTGNGVVLMNNIDYYDAMNQLFSDKMKFKIMDNDLTLSGLKTVQNYLNKLQT